MVDGKVVTLVAMLDLMMVVKKVEWRDSEMVVQMVE